VFVSGQSDVMPSGKSEYVQNIYGVHSNSLSHHLLLETILN